MFTRRSTRVHGASGSSTAPPQQVFTQGIVFTNHESRKEFQKLSTRKIKATKWACESTLTKLGIINNFNLLCDNIGLHHFIYQGCETYDWMMLEFLSILSHDVGLMPNTYEEERMTFCLLNRDFNITLSEWCNHFGFPNNDDDIIYVYDLTDRPTPKASLLSDESPWL